jgi:hypothetical protein
VTAAVFIIAVAAFLIAPIVARALLAHRNRDHAQHD